MEQDLKSRFAGCLLGLAAGDCLGADLEGYQGDELIRAYLDGRYRVDNLALSMWTDDTALAVATAQSIVDCGRVDGPDLAAKYLAWFEGGGRGIGRSTYLAMERLQRGVSWEDAGVNDVMAAGNGVAMRIAPVGLWHASSLDGLWEDVRTCGIITHHNEEALIGADCVAYAVARAVQEDFDYEVLGIELLSRMPPCRCRDGIEEAMAAWQDGVDVMEALAGLGLGGAAFETVPSALYCCWLGEGDMEKVLCLSVLSGGDADTRGAIAGAIAGAHLGADAVPAVWRKALTGAQSITGLANDLFEASAKR